MRTFPAAHEAPPLGQKGPSAKGGPSAKAGPALHYAGGARCTMRARRIALCGRGALHYALTADPGPNSADTGPDLPAELGPDLAADPGPIRPKIGGSRAPNWPICTTP